MPTATLIAFEYSCMAMQKVNIISRNNGEYARIKEAGTRMLSLLYSHCALDEP